VRIQEAMTPTTTLALDADERDATIDALGQYVADHRRSHDAVVLQRVAAAREVLSRLHYGSHSEPER
jgi:hypothetical protein